MQKNKNKTLFVHVRITLTVDSQHVDERLAFYVTSLQPNADEQLQSSNHKAASCQTWVT